MAEAIIPWWRTNILSNHKQLWEQSLLAIALYQATLMLAVRTLSRASFAPTGVCQTFLCCSTHWP
ncbi:hypothetical protein C9I50_24575 [Pseudomonas prosekii]|nr:hypothetical protein C9I50_24575 [Pseudomonas prosekii]